MENTQIKVLLLDDDNDFINILCVYLKKLGITKIKMVNTFEQGEELLHTDSFDLALLDVDLKDERNGIDFGHCVREKSQHTRIIYFTNNFREDIFEATKTIRPNAFLDKQLDELKVRQAVELAMLETEEAEVTLRVTPSLCYFAKEFIFVKVGLIFKKVDLKEIDYVFYADRYSNLQIEGRTYPLNITMKQLSKNLPEHLFIQIHQSYIINIQKITQVSTVNNQVEVMGKWLPIGVSHKKDFQERLIFIS